MSLQDKDVPFPSPLPPIKRVKSKLPVKVVLPAIDNATTRAGLGIDRPRKAVLSTDSHVVDDNASANAAEDE